MCILSLSDRCGASPKPATTVPDKSSPSSSGQVERPRSPSGAFPVLRYFFAPYFLAVVVVVSPVAALASLLFGALASIAFMTSSGMPTVTSTLPVAKS